MKLIAEADQFEFGKSYWCWDKFSETPKLLNVEMHIYDNTLFLSGDGYDRIWINDGQALEKFKVVGPVDMPRIEDYEEKETLIDEDFVPEKYRNMCVVTIKEGAVINQDFRTLIYPNVLNKKVNNVEFIYKEFYALWHEGREYWECWANDYGFIDEKSNYGNGSIYANDYNSVTIVK